MKTTKEVLHSLDLIENSTNKLVAKNYSNILNFINEIKNDIKSVEVLDYQYIKSNDTRVISCEMNSVFDKENLRTLKASTNFGTYHFSMPINTGFYSYICVLLKIQSSYKKQVEFLAVENTIFIDNNIVASITKAVKFTNGKSFNEICKNIYLRFENDIVEVYATTGVTLYKSQKFSYISDKKIENLVLNFDLLDVHNFKTNKNDFLQIDIIDKKSVMIGDKIIFLSSTNFAPIEKFCFDVEDKMEFSKNTLQSNIKSLKPILDYKKIVKFHLNGAIQMQPVTREPNQTIISIDYISKDFGDKDYNLNFDAISSVLMGLKSKNILFSPKELDGRKMALLTDNVDSFLIANNLNE